MSDTLHVSNLPDGLDEGMVTEFFAIYGTVVEVKIPRPGPSGKTAAIVKFTSNQEAADVLTTLNGTVPAGLEHPLDMKMAGLPPPPRPPPIMGAALQAAAFAGVGAASSSGKWNGGAATKGPGGEDWSEPPMSNNLYVQGLPEGTTQDSAMSTFAEFGEVVSIKLLDKPGMPCAALIRFKDVDAAKLTKEILNGARPEGFPCPLKVRYANQKGSAPAAPGGKGVPPPPGVVMPPGVVPPPPPAVVPPGLIGVVAALTPFTKAKGAQGKGLIPPPPPPPVGIPGGYDADTLVNLVIQSGYLPGGQLYKNDDASVYVAGLPLDSDEHCLYRMFSPYGAIHSTHIRKHPMHNWVFAFVNYLDVESAEAAVVAYNGMELPTGGLVKANIKSRQKAL